MSKIIQKFRYTKAYREIPEPLTLNQLPKLKMDLKGLSQYAHERGKLVKELSEDEKKMFLEG